MEPYLVKRRIQEAKVKDETEILITRKSGRTRTISVLDINYNKIEIEEGTLILHDKTNIPILLSCENIIKIECP